MSPGAFRRHVHAVLTNTTQGGDVSEQSRQGEPCVRSDEEARKARVRLLLWAVKDALPEGPIHPHVMDGLVLLMDGLLSPGGDA